MTQLQLEDAELYIEQREDGYKVLERLRELTPVDHTDKSLTVTLKELGITHIPSEWHGCKDWMIDGEVFAEAVSCGTGWGLLEMAGLIK